MKFVVMKYLCLFFICILNGKKHKAVEGCTAGQFECSDRECISDDLRCDNEFNCEDMSDEENCASILPPCPEGQYRCTNRKCVKKKDNCSPETSTPADLTSGVMLRTYSATSGPSFSEMFYMPNYSESSLKSYSGNNIESKTIIEITIPSHVSTTVLHMSSLSYIKSQSEVRHSYEITSEFDQTVYYNVHQSTSKISTNDRIKVASSPFSSVYYDRQTIYTSYATGSTTGYQYSSTTSPMVYSLYPSFTQVSSLETKFNRQSLYTCSSSLISPSYIGPETSISIKEVELMTISSTFDRQFLSPTRSIKESDYVSINIASVRLIKSHRQNPLSDLDTPLSYIDQVSSGRISLFTLQSSQIGTGVSNFPNLSRVNTLRNSSPTEVTFSSSLSTSLRLFSSEQVESYKMYSNTRSNDSSYVMSLARIFLDSDSTSLQMKTITQSILNSVKYIHKITDIFRPSSAISDLFLEENIYSSSFQNSTNQTGSFTLFSSGERIYESKSLRYHSSSEITQSIYMSEISRLATTPIEENVPRQDSLFLLVIIPFTVLFLMILIGFLVLVHRYISSFRGKRAWKKVCGKEFKVDMGQPNLLFYKTGNRIVTSSYSSLTQMYFNNNLCE